MRACVVGAGPGGIVTAKVLLENGGSDPLIVDSDVDPRWAAEQAATRSIDWWRQVDYQALRGITG